MRMNFNHNGGAPLKPVEVVKPLNGKKCECVIGFLDGSRVGACFLFSQTSRECSLHENFLPLNKREHGFSCIATPPKKFSRLHRSTSFTLFLCKRFFLSFFLSFSGVSLVFLKKLPASAQAGSHCGARGPV